MLQVIVEQLFWLCMAVGLFCLTCIIVAGTIYAFLKLAKR